ncbi:MAG: dynamin family protein [Nocardiaceae bacterium]|nr:dynamin family protein [Nocardiaceae bacterium]
MSGDAVSSAARSLLDRAVRLYAHDPVVSAQVADCIRRLEQPLRIAVAGAIKAGKSTLLNSLVGQAVAPTDATECTRVVTWYRHGPHPTVAARMVDGSAANVRVVRVESGLSFDVSDLDSDRIDHIDVEWPAPALAATTIVDTPGTSSLSHDVSARTLAMFAPVEGTSNADAVVYLLRSLSEGDVSFLKQIAAHIASDAGPLGVIGVVSRADEVGAGRIDSMNSAHEMAARFAGELERNGLCQAVVPVAGLLAFAAKTLREAEFSAFVALAAVPVDDLQLALLSADRFARADMPLPVDPGLRAELVRRFGLFGIRLAVTMIRLGVRDSSTLAAELLQRSGIEELRNLIDIQFGQRAEQLKSHSVLTGLARVLQAHPVGDSGRLLVDVQRTLADVHGFAELRLLGRLRTTKSPLPEADQAELVRLIGGLGVHPVRRLGLVEHADRGTIQAAAVAAVHKWRQRAKHPLLDRGTAKACEVAARSAEGIVKQLAQV